MGSEGVGRQGPYSHMGPGIRATLSVADGYGAYGTQADEHMGVELSQEDSIGTGLSQGAGGISITAMNLLAVRCRPYSLRRKSNSFTSLLKVISYSFANLF